MKFFRRILPAGTWPGWIRAIEVVAGIILATLSFNIRAYLLVAGVSVV